MMLSDIIILAAFFAGFGGLIIFGIKNIARAWERRKWAWRWKSELIITIFFTVFFLACFILMIWIAVGIPDSNRKTAEFKQTCVEQGGVPIRLDNVGLECWENKLGER